jgi:hypothetical protein
VNILPEPLPERPRPCRGDLVKSSAARRPNAK